MAIKLKEENITLEEYNKIENELFNQLKENVSNVNIICPRCGNHMKYIERGNSYMIKCQTDNCINYGVRGI